MTATIVRWVSNTALLTALMLGFLGIAVQDVRLVGWALACCIVGAVRR